MIGIALKPYNKFIVSEFFELFKTPWAIFQPDRAYDVLITDENQIDQFHAKLVIVIHRHENTSDEKSQIPIRRPVLAQSAVSSFPIFTAISEVKGGSPLIKIARTGECIGNHFSNSIISIVHLGYNFFEEIFYLLNNGQPPEYSCFPTVDIHIANLRTWILDAGISLLEIPPVAQNSQFFACLTHDVDFAGIRNYKLDRTTAGFVYRAMVKSVAQYWQGQFTLKMLVRNWMAVVKLPFIHLGLLKDFWMTFQQYRLIEGEVPSTFFFVPFKDKSGKTEKGNAPSIRAVKYDVIKLKNEVLYLTTEGCEIGIHGIDSWIDAENSKREIGVIRDLTGQSELGVRMHWLFFGPDSPEKLEQAGYAFDSTCGYNERIGYKAGTSQVYRPPGVKHLLELPMHIMDTALFYPDRMNLTFSEGITAIQSLIEKATIFGGVLTFNWHDRSIAPERLWDGVYRRALNELQLRGARFLAAGAVVEWFRKRRAVLFEPAYGNSTSRKIRLTGLDMSPDDGMVLRVYSPSKQPSVGQFAASTLPPYQDLLLGEQKEIEFEF